MLVMTQPRPNNTGTLRAAVAIYMYQSAYYNVYPLQGNIDAAHTMCGRAVLPCSERVHDTHRLGTTKFLGWLSVPGII